jgi:multidrug resistance efflux pump
MIKSKYQKKSDKKNLASIFGTKIPYFFPRISVFIIFLLVFFAGVMFLPWIQTAPGKGYITALHPFNRVQKIVAPVNGRVEKWFVYDGARVKKGQKIASIIDIDPYALNRLESEKTALADRLMAMEVATKLAKKNLDRQERLYHAGLTSRREYEAAEINYQKSLSEQKYYGTQLIKIEGSVSRQSNQVILAERDGYIVKTLASSGTRIVKAGDFLANFMPDSEDIAAELYISGNDIPLIKIGQKVRLIFDGWPAIQFSGWPSVSIGTFGGRVAVIDYAVSKNGFFRVLVKPDPNDHPWPSKDFLRMGTKLQGVIQMNQVSLGYELWRQMNGFPIAVNQTNAPFWEQKK